MADTAIQTVARQLRNQMDAQHAAFVSNALGCPVTVLRHTQLRTGSGKFSGVTVPVLGMPAEFVEQAQILGLVAEAR